MKHRCENPYCIEGGTNGATGFVLQALRLLDQALARMSLFDLSNRRFWPDPVIRIAENYTRRIDVVNLFFTTQLSNFS